MKLIVLLISIALVQIGIKAQAQVTLDKKDIRLAQVFQVIEKQTGYVFLYTDKELPEIRIDIKVKDLGIAEALELCFKDLPYTFKVVENTILVRKEKQAAGLAAPKQQDLPLKVEGTVSDNKGLALSGATIRIENTNIGTISGPAGEYSLRIPDPKAVLVFSFVGFTARKLSLNGRTQLNVNLAEDAAAIAELQVVGYGIQKKASVVGAISNINLPELRRAAPSNLSNALGGSMPGLITRMGDGAIGGVQNRYSNGSLDDAQIYIRGKSTLNAQAALVLIDGVEGSLSRMNPEDIEQFTVLKDASATAIYGVRGGNGVILITTRRGEPGKPKLSATSQFRRMQPLDFPKFLGSYDYASLYNEALRNADLPELYTARDLELYRNGKDPFGHSDVNWADVLMKDHFMEQQHVASLSGGTARVRYYISGEYNQSGGIFVGSKANNTDYNYRRYNLRSNLDFTITKSTELSVKLNGRLNDLNTPIKAESSGQRINGVAWADIVARRPTEGQLYNPDGSYSAGLGAIPTWNTLADLYDGGFIRRLSNTIESNFTLNQKLDFISPGLWFRALYGMSFSNGSTKQLNRSPGIFSYDPLSGVYTLEKPAILPWYSIVSGPFQDFGRTQQIELSLNYDKVIAADHHLSAMGVFTQSTNELQAALPRYFQGIAVRVTYAYKNKYLAEGNLGYNGSDAFNKARRYALFPAGALGWVLSEEHFLKKHLKFISFMKLRASYGEVGNDRLNGGLQYFYQYNFTAPSPIPGSDNMVNGYYNLGTGAGSQQIGLVEGTLGNDLVTWETARKTNLGLDLKLFNGRLSFTGDIFYEKRNDILTQRADFPMYTGLTTSRLPALNIGKVDNRGIEFSLGYADRAGGLGYNIGGNYTFVRNKIVYRGEASQKYAWQYATGHPIGTESLYTWTGRFYSEEDLLNPDVPKPVGITRAGELMFADLNGDKLINSDDMAYQGYTETPEVTYGMNMGLDYKGLYLSASWYGASNVAYRPSGAIRYEFANNIQPYQMAERWVYDPERGLDTRSKAKYPLLMVGAAPQTRQASTFHKLNAAYLRLRAIELGYDFPKALVQKLQVTALRVFISGSNLLTFSGMKKYHIDPEYIGANNPDAAGTNGASTGVYSPQNKFYALGLNIVF